MPDYIYNMGIRISKIEEQADTTCVDIVIEGSQPSLSLVCLISKGSDNKSECRVYCRGDLSMQDFDFPPALISYTLIDFINSNLLASANVPITQRLEEDIATVLANSQPNLRLIGNERIMISATVAKELKQVGFVNEHSIKRHSPSPSPSRNSPRGGSIRRIVLEELGSSLNREINATSVSPWTNRPTFKSMMGSDIQTNNYFGSNRVDVKESILIGRANEPTMIHVTGRLEQASSLPIPTRYDSPDALRNASSLKGSGHLYKHETVDRDNKVVRVRYSCSPESVEPLRVVSLTDSAEIKQDRYLRIEDGRSYTIEEFRRSSSPQQESHSPSPKIIHSDNKKSEIRLSYPAMIYTHTRDHNSVVSREKDTGRSQHNLKPFIQMETYNIFEKPHVEYSKATTPGMSIKITETNSRKESDISVNGTDFEMDISLNNSNTSRNRPDIRSLVEEAKHKLDKLLDSSHELRTPVRPLVKHSAYTQHRSTKTRPFDFILSTPDTQTYKQDTKFYKKSKPEVTINKPIRFKEADLGSTNIQDEEKDRLCQDFSNCCCCKKQPEAAKVFSENLEKSLRAYMSNISCYLDSKQNTTRLFAHHKKPWYRSILESANPHHLRRTNEHQATGIQAYQDNYRDRYSYKQVIEGCTKVPIDERWNFEMPQPDPMLFESERCTHKTRDNAFTQPTYLQENQNMPGANPVFISYK